ncbi:chalcone-flavanone isomerase-domain-containing protein [Russula earlei]|uniref:Chalcone-flavanone isomerase-domain-containing protein n=1 Tax=Russula earlei TaxID=71964 RepID=A0ACC0U6V0_9AGAM|nr:chalcone-flavanone isomerase-domain-containing protein [Russula earlei]
MSLRRILVSTFPHRRLYLSYFPNSVDKQLLRLRPIALGAAALALSLSAAVGFVHLDSNIFREKESTVVEPATSFEFPATLRIPSRGALPEFTLLGVGVGVVTFFKIKVYSAAFYADLSNPSLKIPSSASPEEKLAYIVRNTACVLRIVPTRNTTYSHIRDGFIRTLQARHWAASEAGELSSDEQLNLQAPIAQLRSALSNMPFKKGTPLDLVLTHPDPKQPRALIFWELGAVQNDWVARELILSFFDGRSNKSNSAALQQSVFNRVAQL